METAEELMIALNEPPPFEIMNRDGKAPFIILCDHANRTIPQCLGNLGLDEYSLRRHIAYDIGAADVSRRIAAHFDAPLFMTCYSRLIVDPNRHPESESSIPKASEDVVIPGNHGLDEAQIARRMELFFHPYHAAISEFLRGFRLRGAVPAIISIHSFTPAFLGFERPWHIGILWNKDGRMAVPLLEQLRTLPDICVGDNEPYSAHSPEGYSMYAHGEVAGYPHALIEIRQDLIENHRGAAHWATLLTEVLQPVVADPSIYQVRHHAHD